MAVGYSPVKHEVCLNKSSLWYGSTFYYGLYCNEVTGVTADPHHRGAWFGGQVRVLLANGIKWLMTDCSL